ncbi:unnamed protein product [Linum trigynum]|uniref:Uncharacterized protein n=1 Tax=Linum trigynum TaxID=586398 RepID=A0AAV2G045_9ROSI
MSADSSSDDNHPCYRTATAEESCESSIFADSFRSLDLPPGYLHMKSSSILASPRVRSARVYTNSVDEFEPSSSISCRFYDDFSFVDNSDCETGSETHLLIDRSRQQVPAALNLKPPPARNSSGEIKGARSLTPSRRRRSHFHVHRRSLWNDDFDPFVAALKTVRKDVGEKSGGARAGSHRRAWSDSLRHVGPGPGPMKNGLNDPEAMKAERSLRWMKSMPRARARSPSPVPSPPAQMKSPQPKGVMYARHTRMVKMDREEDEGGRGIMDAASCGCGSKREIMKHLVVSMKGRPPAAAEEEAVAEAAEAAAEEAEEKKNEEDRPPKLSRRKRLMRKLSFNRGRNGDVEGEKRASEGRKIVQSKSGLLGCVGIKNKIYAGC